MRFQAEGLVRNFCHPGGRYIALFRCDGMPWRAFSTTGGRSVEVPPRTSCDVHGTRFAIFRKARLVSTQQSQKNGKVTGSVIAAGGSRGFFSLARGFRSRLAYPWASIGLLVNRSEIRGETQSQNSPQEGGLGCQAKSHEALGMLPRLIVALDESLATIELRPDHIEAGSNGHCRCKGPVVVGT